MMEAVTTTRRRLLLLLALLALPSAVFAHRQDECLQATLVDIEPGEIRLDINLTPGVAVAGQVLALIDRDRDGVISTDEAAAYAARVKGDLIVRLDGRDVELKLSALNFPEPADLRTGWGIIQVEYYVTPAMLAAGLHKLTFENRHLPAASVYLLNAARPDSAAVDITAQKRNENQSEGEIAFNIKPPPNPSIPPAIGFSLAALSVGLFAGVRQARKKAKIY
jgi:nickel/cobalt transporter (NicO) family protein